MNGGFIVVGIALAAVLLTPTVIRMLVRMQANAEFENLGLPDRLLAIAFFIPSAFTLVTGVAWMSLRKGWSSARAWGGWRS